MKRHLTSLFFFLGCLPCFGANGAPESIVITAKGWSSLTAFLASYTNGTYATGLGTNRTLSGTERLVLTGTRPGYDPAGNATTRPFRIVGTKFVRQAYPYQAYANEVPGPAEVTNEIALSSMIYGADTVSSCAIAAGLYTLTGLVNSAATLTPLNNSQAAYPTVQGPLWQVQPFNLVTNTMTLMATAFGPGATNGRPVECILFRAHDAHGHWTTTNAGVWMKVYSLAHGRPVAFCVATMDVSAFSQSDPITCDFAVYSREGTNWFDTALTGFSFPSAYPCSLTNICNNAGTYGQVVARVDPVNGSDTFGLAANDAYYAGNQAPAPFLTCGAALKASELTNSASYSHATLDNVRLKLYAPANTTNSFNWMGSTPAAISVGNTTWCHIEPDIGVTRDQVVFTDTSGKQRFVDNVDKYAFHNVTFNGSDSIGIFYKEHIWTDQCRITWTGSDFFQTGTAVNCWYITDCVIPNLTQGLLSCNGQQLVIPLCRGNDLTDFRTRLLCYNACGNVHRASDLGAAMTVIWDVASQAYPVSYFGLLYNNDFRGMSSGSANAFSGPRNFSMTNGWAAIQNIFETGTNGWSAMTYETVSSDTVECTNACVWNNGFYGSRTLMAYNWSGTVPAWRILWSVFDNMWSAWCIKSDDYSGGGNGTRIGNWSVMYGVDRWADADLCTTNVTAAGSFENETSTEANGFEGINCTAYKVDVGTTSPTNYAQWVIPPSYPSNATIGTANEGDYRLTTASPLFQGPRGRWVLPFDINGMQRGPNDPPGPTCTGDPANGSAMLGF